jgi:hypothetical protein
VAACSVESGAGLALRAILTLGGLPRLVFDAEGWSCRGGGRNGPAVRRMEWGGPSQIFMGSDMLVLNML